MSSPELPPRREGSHHDTVSMHCVDTGAAAAYARVKERLYAVNTWRELNDSIRADFQVCDPSGRKVYRRPHKGDYIRIDLPGPGSPAGGGYDWVRVADLAEEDGLAPWASLTVMPAADPRGQGTDIAHFYAEGATNTFVVRRIGNCILVEVHGRNERPNVTEGGRLDRLRNEAVALAGKVGLGKVQWKDWTDGMVSVIEPQANG